MISIIIPVYNGEKKLERCIKSLLNQTYSNFEIIIVDDGSKDGSYDMALKYSKMDNRIHVIGALHGGVSQARNLGISYARGSWITFVDSDDIVDKRYLEYLVKYRAKGYLTLCGYIKEKIRDESYLPLHKDVKEKNTIEERIIRIDYTKGKTFDKKIKRIRDKENIIFNKGNNISQSDMLEKANDILEQEKDILQQKIYILQRKALVLLYRKWFINPCWNKIYDMELIKKYNLSFIKNQAQGEDLLFNLEYIKHANKGFIFINRPLYYYQKCEHKKASKDIITLKYELALNNNLYKNMYILAKHNFNLKSEYLTKFYIEYLKSTKNILKDIVSNRI